MLPYHVSKRGARLTIEGYHYQTLNTSEALKSTGVRTGRIKVDYNIDKKQSFLKKKQQQQQTKQRQQHRLFTFVSGQA